MEASKQAASATAAPVRRGRGTFADALKCDQPAGPVGSTASRPKAEMNVQQRAPEDRNDGNLLRSDGHKMLSDEQLRDVMGMDGSDTNSPKEGPTDTAREQLFRRERRRRHVIFTGKPSEVSELTHVHLMAHPAPKLHRFKTKFTLALHLIVKRTPPAPSANSPIGYGTEDHAGEHSFNKSSQSSAANTCSGALINHESMRAMLDDSIDTHRRLAISPVIALETFDHIAPVLLKELERLWSLDDLKAQRAFIALSFGKALICPKRVRHGLQEKRRMTFSELVDQLNNDQIDFYFVPDAPESIRNVAIKTGHGTSYMGNSVVRLSLFDSDRQSYTNVRAQWDGNAKRFSIVDVQSAGITFTWHIFPLDLESLAMKGRRFARRWALPMELEFHAYRRFRVDAQHPVMRVTQEVLRVLGDVEKACRGGKGFEAYEDVDYSIFRPPEGEFPVEPKSADLDAAKNPLPTDEPHPDDVPSLVLSSLRIEHFETRRGPENVYLEMSNVLLVEGLDGLGAASIKMTRSRLQSCRIVWRTDPSRTHAENLQGLPAAFHWAGALLDAANEHEAVNQMNRVSRARQSGQHSADDGHDGL